MPRLSAWLVVFSLALGGCGILPGSGNDDGGSTLITSTPRPIVTPTPTATPAPTATSTPSPTPTPPPTPTPTPTIDDSFSRLVSAVRAIFSAEDKEAAINALVPSPIDLEIPADAVVERIELEYGRWDRWAAVTGAFPPVDRAASVVINMTFITSAPLDDLSAAYRSALVDAGFGVDTEDSEPGLFSDTKYQFGPGVLQIGRGGQARFSALKQGDTNIVQFELELELNSDSVPALTEWPSMFVVPFSGDFTYFEASAVPDLDGIEVSVSALWTLGIRDADRRATLETLLEQYPIENVALSGEISQAAPDAIAVTTFTHPTGAAGSIAVDAIPEATIIEFRMLAFPG